MHIRPVTGPLSAGPEPFRLPQPRRGRRRLWLMLAGSVLLHALLAALVLYWPKPDQPPGGPEVAANDVSLVMQAETPSPTPASTKSPDQQTPSVAAGSPQATETQPTQNTTPPTQSSAQSTPTPPTPQPPQEASNPPPTPAVPDTTPPPPIPPPAPVQEASIPPPTPAIPDITPPPPTATPPEVSLTPPPPERPVLQPSPEFVPPQPPAPLPPLPRPVRPTPPRRYARPVPRSPSGFPMPQNWALNQAPSPLSSHGFDTAPAPRGGHDDESYRHVGGADPGPDWMSELHRWAAAHAYYPDAARDAGQQGAVTVQLVIDHYGHVLSVDLVSGSGSQFLDAAWMGEWRNAKVPSFPQGTMGDTTTVEYTINYILIRR